MNQEKLRDGYVYFELAEVQIKKKKTRMLQMQLLNPAFSKKFKITNTAMIIFCLSLRSSPHLKGHLSVASRFMSKNSFDGTQISHGRTSALEDLNGSDSTSRSRQVVPLPRIDNTGKSRFFPPSRLRASKEAYRPSTLSPVREEKFFGGVEGAPGSSAVLSTNSNHTSVTHAPSPISVCCHKCRISCCECHQQGTGIGYVKHDVCSLKSHGVRGVSVSCSCTNQDFTFSDQYGESNDSAKFCSIASFKRSYDYQISILINAFLI